MSLDSLYPYAGDHAIQNAVFAVEFEGVLSEKALHDLQKAAERAFGKEFPTVQPQQTVNVNLEFSQVPGAPPRQVRTAPQAGGFVMSRASGFSALPGRSVTVNLNSLVILVSDYTRWAQVKADVDRYLDVLLKASQAQQAIAVRTIGLQYTDVFNWKSDPEDLVLAEALERESPYLARHVFSLPSSSLWHSHHGWFSGQTEPVAYRQLDNVNVNKVETAGAHTIQILTSHRAQLSAPLWKVAKDHRGIISTIQGQLHECNKVIVGSLLTNEVKSKIKLS